MVLVSIDPGVHRFGYALWENEQLIEAGLEKMETIHLYDSIIKYLAIEIPQVYHDRRQQKGDQNDLITLAVAAGEIIGKLDVPTTRYLPRQWKGQTPKDVSARRTKGKLTPEEVARISMPSEMSLQHNVWDAIGIGLYHLGR